MRPIAPVPRTRTRGITTSTSDPKRAITPGSQRDVRFAEPWREGGGSRAGHAELLEETLEHAPAALVVMHERMTA
jgi:hypothetical protein